MADGVTLFLCGDVMLGRGADQLLQHPSNPLLHEPYLRDARDYVALAERVGGPIPHPVAPEYLWGAATDALARRAPHARLINLETSVTTGDEYWPGKDIHYRLHPRNAAAITCAGVDACALANNHLLDFGPRGLLETLEVLRAAGVKTSGAGAVAEESREPAVLPLQARRLSLHEAPADSVRWLSGILSDASGPFGTFLAPSGAGELLLQSAR